MKVRIIIEADFDEGSMEKYSSYRDGTWQRGAAYVAEALNLEVDEKETCLLGFDRSLLKPTKIEVEQLCSEPGCSAPVPSKFIDIPEPAQICSHRMRCALTGVNDD